MPAHPSPSGAASQSPSAQHPNPSISFTHCLICIVCGVLPCSALHLCVHPSGSVSRGPRVPALRGTDRCTGTCHWSRLTAFNAPEFPATWDPTSQVRVLGPGEPSVTVHRLTMHIITQGDATMVLSRMSVSTFDIKGSPSQHPMFPLLGDGHWPVAAGHLGHPNYYFSLPLNKFAVQALFVHSQSEMGSSCGSMSRLTSTSSGNSTSK